MTNKEKELELIAMRAESAFAQDDEYGFYMACNDYNKLKDEDK